MNPQVIIDEVPTSPADIQVVLTTGWPKCKAIASTTLPDGMKIGQIGEASSKHLGTALAGIEAKKQALARLRVAIQLYNQQKPKEA